MQPSESPSVSGVQLIELTIPNLTLDGLTAAQWGEIETAAVGALTARFAIDRRDVTTQLRSSRTGSTVIAIWLEPTGSNTRAAQRVAAEVTVLAPIRIATASAVYAATSASQRVVLSVDTTVRTQPAPGTATVAPDAASASDNSDEGELVALAVVIGGMAVLLGFLAFRIHGNYAGNDEETSIINPNGDVFAGRVLPELKSTSTIGTAFGPATPLNKHALGETPVGRPVSAHFYPEGASGGMLILGSDLAPPASPISLKSFLSSSPTTPNSG